MHNFLANSLGRRRKNHKKNLAYYDLELSKQIGDKTNCNFPRKIPLSHQTTN